MEFLGFKIFHIFFSKMKLCQNILKVYPPEDPLTNNFKIQARKRHFDFLITFLATFEKCQ